MYRQKTVDYDTGEVTESVSVTRENGTTSPYCSLFIDAAFVFKNMGAMEKDVFFQMVKYVEWNTNVVFANEHNRNAIAFELNIKPESVRIAVANMKKMNILRRMRNTVYWINPNILFYGSLSKRDEMLRNGIDWGLK